MGEALPWFLGSPLSTIRDVASATSHIPDLLDVDRVLHRVRAPVDLVTQALQNIARCNAHGSGHDRIVRAMTHQNRHIAIRWRCLRRYRALQGKVS